jgi:hypothetical protein
MRDGDGRPVLGSFEDAEAGRSAAAIDLDEEDEEDDDESVF